MKIKPATMLLTMLAGWINKEQQHVIEYLKEENKSVFTEFMYIALTACLLLGTRSKVHLTCGMSFDTLINRNFQK